MSENILLVEDEEDLRAMMCEALELYGYKVISAQDGQDALDRLDQLDRLDRVCLILLDLVMPRMNGWDFLERMRALPQFADVPVIVHSSTPRQAPERVTRVLKKPVELERLLAVVQELCAA
jgi:CheY-like chemotaxis protein